MTVDILLIIFVGVTAISFLVQAVFIWRTMKSAKSLVDSVSKSTADIEGDVRQVVGQLQEVTIGLEHVRRSFEEIGDRAVVVNEMFDARAKDVDHLMQKLVDVGTRQADRIDEVVADTVSKFEQTTGMIQSDILRPVVEIASLIRGLKTGVDYLFSRRQSRVDDGEYNDDDMFI
ncbi:MAG: DUF948 domain-containing protein [Acidobacteriota bacterium]|nr:MAG: DUF948 domain-containing protein [Acidobacteriota bacterium]